MIVVDASVAVKWFRPEPDTSLAFDFLETYRDRLIAPDTILSEVAAAFVREKNMGMWSAASAREALAQWTSDWGNDAIDCHRVTRPMVEQAGRIALDIGHPISDCVYLALAIEQDAELATADARFIAKVAGRHGRCRLLADYA